MPSGRYKHTKEQHRKIASSRKKPREMRTCALPGCNNTFEVIVDSTKKYCSSKCYNIDRVGKFGVVKCFRTKWCGCGCGGQFKEDSRYPQQFICGHNNRGKKFGSYSEERVQKAREGCIRSGRRKHRSDCNCASCRSKHGEYKGENHPCWKGGVLTFSNPYPKGFVNIRGDVKKRDGRLCQLCSKSEIDELRNVGHRLAIHHIDYNKENCVLENLITLCCGCNARVNRNREFWTEFFDLMLDMKLFVSTNKSVEGGEKNGY